MVINLNMNIIWLWPCLINQGWLSATFLKVESKILFGKLLLLVASLIQLSSAIQAWDRHMPKSYAWGKMEIDQ